MAELPNRLAALTVAQSEREAACESHGAYTAKGFAVGRVTHWMGCPECSKLARQRRARQKRPVQWRRRSAAWSPA